MSDPIDELVARGRAAWPTVVLDVAAVRAHVAALAVPPLPAHGADLYLACACSRGDRAAIERLDASYIHDVPAHVRHLSGAADFGDEVRQRVRVRLLTAADGKTPPIATYGGRGPLGGWIRATAVRVGLSLLGERGRLPPSSSFDWLVADRDPALTLLKARHREAFATALHEALAALGERDRTVLRLTLCAGLSAVRIGKVLGVNHSTVSRWLAAAREEILDGTRRRLTERLALEPGEFESLVRALQSQLDISVARALGA